MFVQSLLSRCLVITCICFSMSAFAKHEIQSTLPCFQKVLQAGSDLFFGDKNFGEDVIILGQVSPGQYPNERYYFISNRQLDWYGPVLELRVLRNTCAIPDYVIHDDIQAHEVGPSGLSLVQISYYLNRN